MRCTPNHGDPIRPRLPLKVVDDLKVVVKEHEIKVEDTALCPFDEEGDPSAEGEGEIIEVSDGEEECAPRRVAPEPGEPTAEEREDHNVDHLPYRCWCEACVKGCGVGEHHKSGVASSIPVIAFDYLVVTETGVYRKGEVDPEEVLSKILVCSVMHLSIVKGWGLVKRRDLGKLGTTVTLDVEQVAS